jgi:hypothetical protein
MIDTIEINIDNGFDKDIRNEYQVSGFGRNGYKFVILETGKLAKPENYHDVINGEYDLEVESANGKLFRISVAFEDDTVLWFSDDDTRYYPQSKKYERR